MTEFDISITFKNGNKFCKVPETYTNYKYAKHVDVLGGE